VNGAEMQYVATDQHRQVIRQVTTRDANGKVTVFNSTDAKVSPKNWLAGAPQDGLH